MRSLNVIAKALDDGDLTLAQIAMLQLGLPELPDGEAANRMAAADRLLKANFNADEPRDSHGRWTTVGGNAGADQRTQLAQNTQSSAAARSGPPSHVHFSGWNQLSPTARRALASIGEDYYRRAGADLAVTSGTRMPKSQAAAMHARLQRGQKLR